ncbi:MAG: RdgB/HAM1 family non-canonical purine NTP pyrophosphatase [Candidatus Marsarchaeota archaeon]|nr:RdgB/HAM1 family non-canonical purine NTP pyrophosphatase [Candidatus Marsarchaeota archaeon]
MEKITLVTHNKGKIAEANELAKRFDIEFVMSETSKKLEIQAENLSDVSEFAARNAFVVERGPLLIEDSGLFVKSLNGFPGVYSAQAFAQIGNAGILKLMEETKDRDAYFECALSFFDGKTMKTFVERVSGSIIFEEKGRYGFGYDPIFSPEGYNGKSFGEVQIAGKNGISHRSKAFEAFCKWYLDEKR